MSVVASRVLDVRKPITSRTGAERAHKARDTLLTAQAIVVASGDLYAAAQIEPRIRELNHQISLYYQQHRANSPVGNI